MKQLKGFVTGVIVTLGLMAIPALAETIEKTITVLPDFVNVKINGEEKDVRNFVNEGTTYIALRDVAELLGCTVDWDDATRTASINFKEEEKPAVEVNGKEISGEEFKKLYDKMYLYYSQYNVPKEEVVEYAKERLVSKEIIIQKAKELKIDTKPLKANAEEHLKSMDLAYGEDLVNQLIEYEGYETRDEFVEDILTSEIYKSVFAELEKTEPEYKKIADGAKAYYEKNKQDYKKKSVQVKHILIPTTDEQGKPLTGDALKQAEEKAKEIKKKATSTNFDKLLKENNNDPGLTEEGYYVDADTNFVEEFKTAALALTRKGQISDVVKTSYGYHIIIALEVNEYVPYEKFLDQYLIEKYTELDNTFLKGWIEQATIVYNDELIEKLTK
ncbi:MAG: peptidylprolyl isomerase [Clostridia bacterium]|nr:peptidylprolyl isomerase [Clostridia bacterium]